jgi:hypothetical protein
MGTVLPLEGGCAVGSLGAGDAVTVKFQAAIK